MHDRKWRNGDGIFTSLVRNNSDDQLQYYEFMASLVVACHGLALVDLLTMNKVVELHYRSIIQFISNQHDKCLCFSRIVELQQALLYPMFTLTHSINCKIFAAEAELKALMHYLLYCHRDNNILKIRPSRLVACIRAFVSSITNMSNSCSIVCRFYRQENLATRD